MKAAVSARLAEGARFSAAKRSPVASAPDFLTMRRDRPVTSATMSVPKRWTIWSSAPGTGGNDARCSINSSRRATASPALDRLAVAKHRPRRQIALAIRERLIELHREAMGEVVQDIFARSYVDADVVPFLGRDLSETPFHQRLAGGDNLDDCGMSGRQVLLDRPDQGRRLHRGQEMAEEALLGALEGRTGG